ncbi:DUF397 domain-containing protein [Streptomyces sp. NPDC059740]|uniref:DUF397 domain-containing protein n=1 Tax=Streptomyces sp. NPDC059740 TaxID=3346926 RepID=UPI00365C3804
MMRHDLPEDQWRKSSYSPDNGPNCVEVQTTAGGRIAVGDSKMRALGAHTFPAGQWQKFIDALLTGAL